VLILFISLYQVGDGAVGKVRTDSLLFKMERASADLASCLVVSLLDLPLDLLHHQRKLLSGYRCSFG
jgi:hypothetical protein